MQKPELSLSSRTLYYNYSAWSFVYKVKLRIWGVITFARIFVPPSIRLTSLKLVWNSISCFLLHFFKYDGNCAQVLFMPASWTSLCDQKSESVFFIHKQLSNNDKDTFNTFMKHFENVICYRTASIRFGICSCLIVT